MMMRKKFHTIFTGIVSFFTALTVIVSFSGVFVSAHLCHGRTSALNISGIAYKSTSCGCLAFTEHSTGQHYRFPVLKNARCCKNIKYFNKLQLPVTIQQIFHISGPDSDASETWSYSFISTDKETVLYHDPDPNPDLHHSGRNLLIALNQLRIPLS